MKSKFTSILMFFIIIVILMASVLLIKTIFKEISGGNTLETSKALEDVQLFETEDTNDSQTKKNLDTSIEAPKIKETTKSNPLTELESSNNQNTQTQNVNYDNVIVNKYFYTQLNSYSQTIYKAFENNKENMKSGNYKISLGNSFSSLLEENGQKILGDYYQSAIEAYIFDNPDVFYIDPSKMFLNIETITRGSTKTYNLYIDCGEGATYLTDQFSTKSQVEEAIRKVENIRNSIISRKTTNTYTNIKMAHDYLVDNIEYDSSTSMQNIYNIYGALVNNKCVCEGYAKALKYLLDGMGIESCIVIGKATNYTGESENHAWNYVKVNDVWYAVDATWDDPVIVGGGTLSSESKRKYLLKGSNTISKDHFPSGKFTENGKTFNYPTLSSGDY